MVEDSAPDAHLIQLSLKGADWADVECEIVPTIAEAAKRLADSEYSLVLADMSLPDSTGIETVERAVAAASGIPVVVYSGHVTETIVLDAIAAGAEDCVAKDAGKDLLEHAIRLALLRARNRGAIRALVEQSFDAMLFLDEQGTILFVNPAASELFGKSPEELVGTKYELALGGNDSTEVAIDHPSGRVIQAALVTRTIRWQGSTAILATLQDRSDSYRAREYERRLMHADRLATIGRLAAGVAHEINNPATYIVGNVELLHGSIAMLKQATANSELSDDLDVRSELEGADELLDDCRTGIRRIVDIVRQLNVFARIDDDEIEVVDINELIRSTARMAQSELKHRAVVKLDLEPVSAIAGHATRLSQLVLNLLVNAGQAMEEGNASGNEIRVSTRSSGENILLEVRDTGKGISPDHIASVFEPFFTTQPRGVGTGLGLAVCRETAVKHGGEIEVSSQLGVGTTFTITLPVRKMVTQSTTDTTTKRRRSSTPPAPRPPEPAPRLFERALTSRSSSSPPADALTVLLVDDDNSVRRTLRRLLKRRYHIEEADCAVAAMEILDRGDKVDVVLCDVMMPDTDGIELYQKATAAHPWLPGRFVFLTGGTFADAATGFLENTTARVIQKPVSPEELERVLEEVASAMGPVAGAR